MISKVKEIVGRFQIIDYITKLYFHFRIKTGIQEYFNVYPQNWINSTFLQNL